MLMSTLVTSRQESTARVACSLICAMRRNNCGLGLASSSKQPLKQKVLMSLKSALLIRLVELFVGSFLLSFLFFSLEFFLESGYVIGCFLGNLFLVVVHLAAVC